MKQFNKALIGTVLMGSSFLINAQGSDLDTENMRDGESVEYCVHHKKMQEMLKNPAALKVHHADQLTLEQAEIDYKINKSQGKAPIRVIPVVFHVLHNNGSENISRDQILDALFIMNRDYALQNADANNVVSAFQGMPAASDIEFRLATKAPNGACFSGITRTQSALSNDGSDGQAQVSAIINGNDVYNGQWPGDEYLNIFVCGEIGGAAGYTYTPSNWLGGSMYNGIWVLDTYVGSIGTSSVYTSRTLTHEAGHWLNLAHPWGPNNNPGNASSCSDDDGVTDTPNTIGVTACILGENTCGPLANVENYMDYSYCSKMFTQGQVDRMRSALSSNVGGRNNLWQTSNLNATGVNGNAPLCEASFYGNNLTICAGETVDFTDDSFHNVTGWDWSFTGGSPATSANQNPSVTYNTPGTYAVALTVTDGNSSVSKTENAYIKVLPATGRAVPFSESFESISLPDDEWIVNNPDGANAWSISSAAGATGSKSLRLNNTSNDEGDVDDFISSTIDLSNVTDFELSFKYAFAKKNSSNTDYLRVYASSDCGETWSVRKNISSSQIATANNQTSSFTPSSDEWETVTITNIVNTYWNENFRFKFEFVSGGGNNVYIDDINLYDPTTNFLSQELNEINNLKIFPNPAGDIANVSFELRSSENVEITVNDMIGKKVMTVFDGVSNSGEQKIQFNTNELSTGVYTVNLNINEKSTTKKLIIE